MRAATIVILAAAACHAQPAFEAASIKSMTGAPPMFGKWITAEQLGLKPVPTQTLVTVLIVDAIERPGEN
jgi:hypothetical protein